MVSTRIRKLLALVIVAAIAMAATASAQTTAGPLSGAWIGYISGAPGSGVPRLHVQIVVNDSETGGTWRISSTCQGSLKLESISNGYHHYFQKPVKGATCPGGNVYCLKRAGADLYDDVTSRISGEYDTSGTLRRIA